MSDSEAGAWRIYARRQPVSDAARHYLLSAAEGIRIFQERIIPDLLTGPQPQEQPTVVFVVGQHGAGKSSVADVIAEVLNKRGGFAELDSDLYKPYHPRYQELMRRDDTLMAAYVGPDSWAWRVQAHEYARAQVQRAQAGNRPRQPGCCRAHARLPGGGIPRRGHGLSRAGGDEQPGHP